MGSAPKPYKKILLICVIVLGLGAMGAYIWYVLKNTARTTDPMPNPAETAFVENSQPEPVQIPSEAAPLTKVAAVFDQATSQTTIDTWNAQTPGVKGVVIASADGTVVASINPDQPFFAASIYKLYTAYFGYIEVDAGRANSAEAYSNGRTRSECLDVMIRESDSPCGEKMMNEIGKAELTSKLKAVGITSTEMGSLSTTARDAATIMAKISKGEGLTPASQATFLESARNQIFRDALNKGFSTNVTVYNKIGFKELKEYHDVAIVELKDGRTFIVAVLTENVGTKNIAELGRRLEAIVQQ